MPDVYSITHLIQLAVAPVFLLTGVGAMLSVLTMRMSRVVDRGHVIVKTVKDTDSTLQDFKEEIQALKTRSEFIHRSIIFCSLTAFFICLVIMTIFAANFIQAKLGILVAGLFGLAMLSFIISLVYFLREVAISSHSIKLALSELYKK
jgi:hypothetical protein